MVIDDGEMKLLVMELSHRFLTQIPIIKIKFCEFIDKSGRFMVKTHIITVADDARRVKGSIVYHSISNNKLYLCNKNLLSLKTSHRQRSTDLLVVHLRPTPHLRGTDQYQNINVHHCGPHVS